jgi:hypothetical protein
MSNISNIDNLSTEELLFVRNKIVNKKWEAYREFNKHDSLETELTRIIEKKCKHNMVRDDTNFDPCRTCRVCTKCGKTTC